jgi:hypothetical protein
MQGYVTIRGEIIPFFAMSEEHRDYLERCRCEWPNVSADSFKKRWLPGPWPRPEPGFFLGVNLFAEPLWHVLFDMWWRLRLGEGEVKPEPDDDRRDPFRHAGPPSAAPARH